MGYDYAPNEFLKEKRVGARLKLREMGEILDINTSVVWGYESGRARAPLGVRKRLGELCGLSERDFRQRPISGCRKMRSDVKNPDGVNYRLVETIRGAGLNLSEVCSLLGYGTPRALSDYVSGKIRLSRGMADKIAGVVGCESEELLPLHEEYLGGNPRCDESLLPRGEIDFNNLSPEAWRNSRYVELFRCDRGRLSSGV